MSRCFIIVILHALICNAFAKNLLDTCAELSASGQYRTRYIECPPQCIVIRYPAGTPPTGDDASAQTNSPITFDDSLKACTQLGKDHDREGRMVRFSEENDFVPVVSELIPNVTFFIGAKRKEEGFTWNYGDYVYVGNEGEEEVAVAKIPPSFVYMDTTATDNVDNTNLLCLQVMCKQFQPSAPSTCVFSRTQCNDTQSIVCELVSSTADIKNADARSCYNCLNGDVNFAAKKDIQEIISPGFPRKRVQQSMECVSVVSTGDEWNTLINVTAQVGCLEHVDDFLEIYHEKTRVSEAKLIARLRSGSKAQLIVPANVLLRYHASDVAKEYVSGNDSHEIYFEPSKEERLAQLMRAIDTVASPLEHCASMSEQGFRVQVSTTNDNYCPEMFYDSTYRWQNITIAGEHLTADIECALVIAAPRNRSVMLEIVEAHLVAGQDGSGDFLRVYDGPEVEDPVIELPEPSESPAAENILTYSNITNTTETGRFLIVLKMGAHAQDSFGSVTIRYRTVSSRKWGKKRMEGSTGDRANGSWRYWRADADEDSAAQEGSGGAFGTFVLLLLLTIAIVTLATGIFAYYRRWPICIKLKGKLTSRSIL